MEKIPRAKIKIIRRNFIAGEVSCRELGRELGISHETVGKYVRQFREIRRLFPHKLGDHTFVLPRPPRPENQLLEELKNILAELIENPEATSLERLALWKQYRVLCPKGYSLFWFSRHFNTWQQENHICKYHHRRIKFISDTDRQELVRWRNADDFQLWRKAVVILDSEKARPVTEMAAQLELVAETILGWIDRFREQGVEGIRKKTYTQDPKMVLSNQLKRENILHLLQQTPQNYDVNRTSWSLKTLSIVYERLHHTPLGAHAICSHLKAMGYKFQKSRERLVSPDKDFQAKMDKIKTILSNLKSDEKFFSIDEYGPAAINMKVGWSMTAPGEVKLVPALQKSRGWYIMTAALELSTNQVTHFYSIRKDTEEMIKMADLLALQYQGNRKLYLSWDAASWHRSNKLKDHLVRVNSAAYRKENGTPLIELAPLPSSAQYLNVIESVFSGMSKSVIHNSNYASLDECKTALDRYFAERNLYFRENPRKAGKKIWGKEIVKPVFDQQNNCKSRLRKPG